MNYVQWWHYFVMDYYPKGRGRKLDRGNIFMSGGQESPDQLSGDLLIFVLTACILREDGSGNRDRKTYINGKTGLYCRRGLLPDYRHGTCVFGHGIISYQAGLR